MTVFQIICKLQDTGSTKEKQEILVQNEENQILVNALVYAYHPDWMYGISLNVSTGLTSVTGHLTFEEASCDIFNLFDKLKTRQITGHSALGEVKNIVEKCDINTQTIIFNILNKDLKIGMAAKSINKVFPRAIPEFQVQLANEYKPDKKYKTDYWCISPKLDGLRCLYKRDRKFYTRQGKEFVGLEHIQKYLDEIFDKFPQIDMFDGELMSPNVHFNTIASYVNKKKNIDPVEKEKIVYNVFMMIGDDIKEVNDYNRLIYEIHTETEAELSVYFLEQYITPNTQEAIYSQLEEYISAGYEGAMLRNPKIPYEAKRSDALLKVKKFLEGDFTVKEISSGSTGSKFESTMGNITVQGEYQGKPYRFDVGSGFTDEMRGYIWGNKEKVVGSIVEIKFQETGIVVDKDGFYSVRFPVFMKFK